MQDVQVAGYPRPGHGSGVLTVGFGTTVAMWGLGYVGRLPAVLLPSPVLLLLLLAATFAGGVVLGRTTRLGWPGGALAGLVSGTLNLLVMGSFLTGPSPNQVVPSALWWIPGSVLVSVALAAAGAAVGGRFRRREGFFEDWDAAFVRIAVAATLFLLAVGGLVTSAEAGLAVVDWPNSFGYNMFLYPFSRMTGPIYYEHAHRLFGALVGLTTLVLAVFLQRVEPRAWVRRLGWLALVMVVVQGLLGGLRVTGGLTLSTSPGDMAPSIVLATVHGVLGQLFLATLVVLAVFTSASWREPPEPCHRSGAGTDRTLGILLVAVILAQLVLGAIQRHLHAMLIVHMVTGVAIVAPLMIHVGVRAWGLNEGQRLLQRLGLTLLGGMLTQILLGFAAYAAKGAAARGVLSPTFDVTLTTAHQWFGAILLSVAVLLACWNFRLLSGEEEEAGSAT
jgi:cytochrome c oxidase assembly protein subunit 15